ncbi:hypothetical protein KA001_00145 [Patescibacteria group bacterium]|nr:hypothetical protein [Patescibacteria group bacterium]
MSPNTDFMFLSQPLLDTTLSRKLLLNLLLVLKKEIKENSEFFYSFQRPTSEDKLPMIYSLILGQKLEFYNFFITSGLDIYKQFEFLDLPNLTKLGGLDFWNDKRYWILAFLRSFRFVSKFSYPNSNLHLSYEDTQRHLSRIAYANSWISQSTYI